MKPHLGRLGERVSRAASRLVVVALALVATPAAAQVLFTDDFNRADSSTVGNSWVETESAGNDATINANRLVFVTNNSDNFPRVQHTFSPVSSGLLRWTFVLDWARVTGENFYSVFMQLGNSAAFSTPPADGGNVAGAAINLRWGDNNFGFPSEEGFGYVQGITQTQVAVVSGLRTIEVIANLDTETFDLSIDGTTVASGVGFDKSLAAIGSIDAVRLYQGEGISSGAGGNKAFDDVTIEPITVTQTGYAWSDDVASFTSKGDNAALTFQISTVYILAVQVSMEDTVPSGDWVLQVRENGAGSWLDVLGLGVGQSPVWQTYNIHTFAKTNGAVVLTTEFGNTTPPGGFTAVDGEFSDDNNGLTDGYTGTNIYTELQYAIRAEPAAAGNTYEFRVVYEGATLNGGYNILAQAVPAATTQTGYAWSDDVVSFTSKGDNVALTFQVNTVYILAVQVSMEDTVPSGDWVLQVRENGAGSWLDVLGLGVGQSPVWQTYNIYTFAKTNGAVVLTTEFGNTTPPGGFTAVDGEFSDDNNGLTDGYTGTNIYTELQYAIRAEPAAAGNTYEFRVDYQGATLNGGYNIVAQAVPPPVLTMTKSVGPLGDQPPGAVMTYSVVVTNNGVSTAISVVLTDVTPVNTTYVPGTITLNAVGKTDTADADEADFGVTTANAVTVNIGALAAAASATVTFQVTIN